MWSRILIVLSFFSLSVQASPPVEPGTRVTVRLAQASGELPDPEKLVESLEAVGGEHQVRVMRRKSTDTQELTLELWGNFVPQADIPQTLRDTFSVLASADIQVATLEPRDRPKFEGLGQGTVKKVVKIIKKE
jgi:hypothetical protein